MKASVGLAVISALLLGGCQTPAAREEGRARAAMRTYIEYELISVGDQNLPVELDGGIMLVSGSCSLNASGSFQLRLEYSGDAGEMAVLSYIGGEYSLLGAADDEGRQPALFVATSKNPRVRGRRWVYDPMWAEADAAFFRNGLSIGGEITTFFSEMMVFRLASGGG